MFNNLGLKVLVYETNKKYVFEAIKILQLPKIFKKMALIFMHLDIKFQTSVSSRIGATNFLHKLIFPDFCHQIILELIR